MLYLRVVECFFFFFRSHFIVSSVFYVYKKTPQHLKIVSFIERTALPQYPILLFFYFIFSPVRPIGHKTHPPPHAFTLFSDALCCRFPPSPRYPNSGARRTCTYFFFIFSADRSLFMIITTMTRAGNWGGKGGGEGLQLIAVYC